MIEGETRRLMAFLRNNGAFIELNDDALEGWTYALRHFTYEQVKFSALHFLERHPPREVSPAAIRAQVMSLMASGKVQEPMCPDHDGQIARHCTSCAADILTRHRPPELRGRRLIEPAGLTGPPPEIAERFHEITTLATRDERNRRNRTA